MSCFLEAPPDYWLLTDDERLACTNGCGPGALCLMPLLGSGFCALLSTCFHDSCCIHDYEYGDQGTAPSREHRKASDERFLRNMKTQARGLASGFKLRLLLGKAYLYYGLVRSLGWAFYCWERECPRLDEAIVETKEAAS